MSPSCSAQIAAVAERMAGLIAGALHGAREAALSADAAVLSDLDDDLDTVLRAAQFLCDEAAELSGGGDEIAVGLLDEQLSDMRELIERCAGQVREQLLRGLGERAGSYAIQFECANLTYRADPRIDPEIRGRALGADGPVHVSSVNSPAVQDICRHAAAHLVIPGVDEQREACMEFGEDGTIRVGFAVRCDTQRRASRWSEWVARSFCDGCQVPLRLLSYQASR